MTWISGPTPTNCPTCGGRLEEERRSIAETLNGIWDGILGLFRPRWQSSNPDVRQAAVRRLTDQVLLARIARYDSEWSVRAAAVETLTDVGVLEALVREGVVDLTARRRLEELRKRSG